MKDVYVGGLYFYKHLLVPLSVYVQRTCTCTLIFKKSLQLEVIGKFVSLVFRCPENPQFDEILTSSAQTAAGYRGTYHTPPELLHQA